MTMMFVIVAVLYAACHKKAGYGEQNKRCQPFFSIIFHNDYFICFLYKENLAKHGAG